MNETFKSVWDAIEESPREAANMRAKSVLLMALQEWLANWQSTQKDAAKLLGITQPRLSDLKRGYIELFSLDMLVNMAASAGLSPTIHILAQDYTLPSAQSPSQLANNFNKSTNPSAVAAN